MHEEFNILKIKQLQHLFGEDAKLSEVLKQLQSERPFECPQCKGVGHYECEFPHPNEHGGGDWGYITKTVECKLCDGTGYPKVKYVPKMEQVGWKEA